MFAFLEAFVHVPWMLAGLVVLAIPPIIHLLNRRRYDVVEWGAMQFLDIGEVTRRRLLIEELLLMLVRMGLLAMLVLALAGPFLDVRLPRSLSSGPPRDIVLVLDGSASMSATNELGGPNAAERARDWARTFVDGLSPGDGVAVLLVREQVKPIVENLSRDHARIRERLGNLPAPAGSARWPEAVKQAVTILKSSERRQRDIVLLGDNQRYGWADPDTLFRWELLSTELGLGTKGKRDTGTTIWSVNLALGREGRLPNYALTPLASNRPVVPVRREVTFRTSLLVSGQTRYTAPHKIHLVVDNEPIRDLAPPASATPRTGATASATPIPFSFTYRFANAGSHLVRVVLEPDLPRDERPEGYVLRDRVPGDNEQAFSVLVVPKLPVLVVTGEVRSGPVDKQSANFLRKALAPEDKREQPAIDITLAGLDFDPAQLVGEERPGVVILYDVPRLATAQVEALTKFVAAGGGVLVALGERADAAWYNQQLYRRGEGWLPGQLEGMQGDEGKPTDPARPDLTSFNHPMLELSRGSGTGGLGDARFSRWWQLATPGQNAPGTPVGILRTTRSPYPFFVERGFGSGRALVCAVPLDDSFGSILVSLPGYVPLLNEVVFYLAGVRATEFNLRPGQPIRHGLRSRERVEDFRLTPPGAPMLPLSLVPGKAGSYPAQEAGQDHARRLLYMDTHDPGTYRLSPPEGGPVWYVVPQDPRESDLTVCSDEDRERVRQLVGVRYEDEAETILGEYEGALRRQELWVYLLLGVVALLGVELWMTRRVVMKR